MSSKRLKNRLITNSFTYDDHFEQDAISKQVGEKNENFLCEQVVIREQGGILRRI